MRALITHCFYRRVIIWAITATILLSLILFSGGMHTRTHGRILDHLVDFGRPSKGSVESSLSGSGSGRGNDNVGNEGQATIGNIWDTEQDSAASENQKSSEDQSKGTQDKSNQETFQNQGLAAVINPLHWLKYKQ